jgi:hypothetical protein
MYMATSSGEKVRYIRINCDTNLSPSEIERLQRLLETSRYHFSTERLFTAQTYDSVGGRPPIAFSVLRTTLLLKFSLTWTRTERSAIKTVVDSVDKVILDSTHPNRRPKVIYDANGGVAIEIEETDTPRKQREPWTRKEKLAVGGLILTTVAIIFALLNHEIRHFLHLEKQQSAQVEMKPISPAPQPARTIQNPEPLKPEASEPRKIRRTAQTTTTQVKGNGNVTGNNTSGDNNVTGNNNQTGATANAPNGIAITGGTVTNPTVNNINTAPPPRRLTNEQRLLLKDCLKGNAGSFIVGAIANNSEAYRYALDFSEVLSDAGWKNEWPAPTATFMIGGGMWSGVHVSVAGTWDEKMKRASMADGSSEMTLLNCLNQGRIVAAGIVDKDRKTGSIRIDVSDEP